MAGGAELGAAVVQIMLLNIVFSINSIITAIGIADVIPVMAAAVILSTFVMMVASAPIAEFITSTPRPRCWRWPSW